MVSKVKKFRNFSLDPRDQALSFERVREAHQTETAEDYVEMIADLIALKGEARVTDLSERMGVTGATVNKVIQRLNREGLVVNQPYRSLFLTPKGVKLAEACRLRHEVVLNFLLALGVSRKIAELDAEGVEHHVSAETLKAFVAFTASQPQQPGPKRKAKQSQ